MTTNEQKPQPERAHTDEGLRLEREKSDHEYANRQIAIEEESDAATEKSRGLADESLRAAREHADAKLTRSKTPAQSRESISRERAHEDAALQGERAAADADLR